MPESGSVFSRRPADKRFVKQVASIQHSPTNWLPMDIQACDMKLLLRLNQGELDNTRIGHKMFLIPIYVQWKTFDHWDAYSGVPTIRGLENECKLTEIRKYSAVYYDTDTKFRRPNLQLITAYVVQNPFLYGSFLLRKEQMKMQLANITMGEKAQVKEKLFYFPTDFRNLEVILRNNFHADLNRAKRMSYGEGGIRFWESSELANKAMKDDSNPRVMVVARVLTGVVRDIDDFTRAKLSSVEGQNVGPRKAFPKPYFTADGLVIDTFAGDNFLVKFHTNEVYPEQVLVYRDLDESGDGRTSRLTDLIKYCQISYRAGTRFNPDEVTFKGRKSTNNQRRPSIQKEDQGNRKSSSRRSSRDEGYRNVVTMQPRRKSSVDKSFVEEGGKFRGTGAFPKKRRSSRSEKEIPLSENYLPASSSKNEEMVTPGPSSPLNAIRPVSNEEKE